MGVASKVGTLKIKGTSTAWTDISFINTLRYLWLSIESEGARKMYTSAASSLDSIYSHPELKDTRGIKSCMIL